MRNSEKLSTSVPCETNVGKTKTLLNTSQSHLCHGLPGAALDLRK